MTSESGPDVLRSGPKAAQCTSHAKHLHEARFLLRVAAQMQMLIVVFRNSMERDVLTALTELGVDSYTTLPKVLGTGEAGAALDTWSAPGFNSMVLTVLEEPRATAVVDGLRRYRDRTVLERHGGALAFRVFVVACVRAV